LAEAWLLQRLLFSFAFADIPGNHARNKLFFT